MTDLNYANNAGGMETPIDVAEAATSRIQKSDVRKQMKVGARPADIRSLRQELKVAANVAETPGTPLAFCFPQSR